MIKYGFELEFASPSSREWIVNRLQANFNIPIKISNIDTVPDFTQYWYVGTDISVKDALPTIKREKHLLIHGLELRSPIFTQFPSKILSKILGFIKNNGCFITNSCGLHIHFSGVSLTPYWHPSNNDKEKCVIRNFDILIQKVCRLRMPKKQRKHFCLTRSSKYVPINFVNKNHHECRVFNASLKLRAIYHAWKQLDKALKSLELEEINMLGTNEVGVSPTIMSDCVVNHILCPPLNSDDLVGLPQRMR